MKAYKGTIQLFARLINSFSHITLIFVPYGNNNNKLLVFITVDICQVTWKKLRDRYTRIKRLPPSGSEGGRLKWDKEESLRFLDKVLVSRR